MAKGKGNWPTVSKGVFYNDFLRGAKPSSGPQERSMNTVQAPKTSESSVLRDKKASNVNTWDKMTKPFG